MMPASISLGRMRAFLLCMALVLVGSCGDEITTINNTGGGGTGGGDGSGIAVTVSGLQDGGTIHSGFLVGTASVGQNRLVQLVEVSLDARPFAAVSLISSTDWRFALPTGSATWRDGSLHTVAMRAVDPDGNLSPVTTLTVRKGVNRDVNGDGYTDLAVGAVNATGAGTAYVFHGSAAGVPSGASTTAAATLTGGAGSSFGSSVALGDVNGDGYADLAVGAAAFGILTGAYVFHGSATGVASGDSTTADTALTGGNGTRFGWRLAMGDVNGDGYTDLAVGAPEAITAAGMVFVFHGSAAGVPSGDTTTASSTLTGVAGSRLGTSLALGDVNGDGIADLVVGARSAAGNAGAAYVFHGSATGVPSVAATSADSTLTGAATSIFGASVALGDVNGDGNLDLAVGATSASSSTGWVHVFHGTAAGIPGGAYTAAASTLIGPTANSFFGASVALGDVNGDGSADLVVGASGASSDAGAGYIFHGSAAGIPGGSSSTAAAILTGAAGSRFGSAVALGDWNGDGNPDLAVGAAPPAAVAGAAYVFQGSATGIAGGDYTTADTTLTGAPGSQFGWSVDL